MRPGTIELAARHGTIDLDGPVHYADFGGTGRPIVLVHGLGGSYCNWLAVAPRLAAHGRVLALDLVGHGLTRCLGRSARVGANRRLLSRFLAAMADGPAILVGNSMGGYLSLAEAAAEPERVSALVLVDPAIPNTRLGSWDPRVVALFATYALPGAGGALMRLRARQPAETMVRTTLALCCVDVSRVPRDVYEAHVELARQRMASGEPFGRAFLAAQRSLMNRLLRRRRFYRMVAGVRTGALVVQGARDRLVNVSAARTLVAARPDWRLEVLDDIGHVPQLEAPERFLAVVEPWLAAHAA